MQPTKKLLEILLINYFRDCYKEFLKGKIKPYESPDFTIRIQNQHILGIELTRLNPENSTPPEIEQLNEITARENLIDLVRNIFEKEFHYNFQHVFLFNLIKSKVFELV